MLKIALVVAAVKNTEREREREKFNPDIANNFFFNKVKNSETLDFFTFFNGWNIILPDWCLQLASYRILCMKNTFLISCNISCTYAYVCIRRPILFQTQIQFTCTEPYSVRPHLCKKRKTHKYVYKEYTQIKIILRSHCWSETKGITANSWTIVEMCMEYHNIVTCYRLSVLFISFSLQLRWNKVQKRKKNTLRSVK